MKLSDYVANFLAEIGVKDVFVLQGGCVVHLINSIANNNNIEYVPVQHEQAGAMAADCYSRVNNNIGAVVATSGPGATNLLTGICCSYYDSIPVIAITGQVPSGQLKGDSGSRQIGFQETDVVSIFKSVTKYSVLVKDPKKIRYELEKAYYLSMNGRPGPVLLDICDDVQRADINPKKLKPFIPPKEKSISLRLVNKKFFTLINESSRPLIVVGAGVRLSGLGKDIKKLINKLNIPFTLTWGAADLVSHSNKNYVGNFGVTSGRAGNFAIQNSDLIICFGTRLDTHEVGSNIKTFAREAKRIVIDVDPSEQLKYKKMGFDIDLLITCNLKNIIKDLNNNISMYNKKNNLADWKSRIKNWREKYIACDKDSINQKVFVNPYFFVDSLSEISSNNQIVITDCGSNLIWTMQAFKVKNNQRLISAWNHSPMGYSLPASMGAAFANPRKQIYCITGDGGMQINIQELATIKKHNLNIKIFILNNHCHGIIQGTQQSWLNSKFHASDPEFGKLPDPNFSKISKAYGIESIDIYSNKEVKKMLKKIIAIKGPLLINVHMLKESQIYPKLLFGKPIEDSHPLLPREEFNQQMIVKPIS